MLCEVFCFLKKEGKRMNVVMSVCTTVEVGAAVEDAAKSGGLTISRAIEQALRVVYLPNDDEKNENERVGAEKSV